MEQKIVTRNDCDNVIKKCVGTVEFEVVNFKVKPFEDKEREYYKPESILEVSAKISKNISRFRFFLKKFPTAYPSLNKLLTTIRASEREILYYEHFLPMLRNSLQNYDTDFSVQYLYGQLDRFMILEDLSLKFFSPAKKSNHHLLDRFHITLALKAIAKLHLASFAYEEKLKDAEVSRLFDESDLLSQEPIWRKDKDSLGKKIIESGVKGLKTLLKEFQGADTLDPNLNKEIDSLVKNTFGLMTHQTKYRNVFGHGDLHTKNILFKYDKQNIPNECVLVHFGFCRYFLPAYDVLTLIFSSTNRMIRQHYFTYLIKYYHDCLRNELNKHDLHIDTFLKFEDFSQSCNYLMPAIKLQTVLHLLDFGAKPGFYKLVQKDEQLFETYLYQDKSQFVLDIYKKDPIFKDIVNESLEELLQTLQTPQVSRENCYDILENLLQTTDYNLNNFTLSSVGNDEDKFTLVLEVNEQEKKEVSKYSFDVQCGPDRFFKMQDLHCFEANRVLLK